MELWALKVDVATGTYFLKCDGQPQPLLWEGEFSEGPMVPFIPNKVLPVKYSGMGLTLVKLDVYKRMADSLPKDKYGRPQWYKTSTADDISTDDNDVIGSGYTEDYWFFQHAHKLELGISFKAATTKHAFGFHVQAIFECHHCPFKTSERKLAYRHMTENSSHYVDEDITGFPQEQWKQWLEGKEISWQTPDGVVVWS
jgi:hypothetical protein